MPQLSEPMLKALRARLFQNTNEEAVVNDNLLSALYNTLCEHYGQDWHTRFVSQSEEDEIAVRQGKKKAHAPNAVVCTTKGENYCIASPDLHDMPDGFPSDITATAEISYNLNSIHYQQTGSDMVAYKRDSINDDVPTLADSDTKEIFTVASIGVGSLDQFYTPKHGETAAGLLATHNFINGYPSNAVGQFGEVLPALTFFHKNGEVKETQYITVSYSYEDSQGNKVPINELTNIPANATVSAESSLQNYSPTNANIEGAGYAILERDQSQNYLLARENLMFAQTVEELVVTKKVLSDLATETGTDFLRHTSPAIGIIPARQHFDEQGRLIEIGFYDKGGLCDLDYPMGLDSVMYFNPETGERWQRPKDFVDPTQKPGEIDLCALEPFGFNPKDLTPKQRKVWEAMPSTHHNKDGKPVTNGDYVADRLQREQEDIAERKRIELEEIEKAKRSKTFDDCSVLPVLISAFGSNSILTIDELSRVRGNEMPILDTLTSNLAEAIASNRPVVSDELSRPREASVTAKKVAFGTLHGRAVSDTHTQKKGKPPSKFTPKSSKSKA